MNNSFGYTPRVLAIDVFRGITIFIMVFVNELASITDIPQWMKHLPAHVDGMTFVDLVFPAFLFILGMSIPFAIQARFNKGDSVLTVCKHVVLRSIGLIAIGVFMVNAESGHNTETMDMSISLWTFIMFFCVLIIWISYPSRLSPILVMGLKLAGVLGLAALWWIYKGQQDSGMTTQWWGILGLIGWAYLIAGMLFLLVRELFGSTLQVTILSVSVLVFISCFFLLPASNSHPIHALIVVCGTIFSLLMYAHDFASIKYRSYWTFTGVVALLAIAIWQFSPISKIQATPAWALFSVLFCCWIFAAIYWLVEVKSRRALVEFFEPSAANPLLIYILPYIVLALCGVLGFQLRPDFFNAGFAGIVWSLGFAYVIMEVGALLSGLGVKLKL